MAKIALNMIFKGTETGAEIVRCLSSVAPHVDAIYMTVTQEFNGPAVAIAKTFGAIISEFKWVDDFSAARNFALSQVPDEFEYILWLDSDDVLVGGESVKPLLGLNFDRCFCMYHYAIDEKTGLVLQKHAKDRIFRKKYYKWGANDLPVGALHENTTPLIDEAKDYFTEKLIVRHLPNEKEKAEKGKRNLRILEKAYKKEGENHDPRTEFYLARAYLDEKEDVKAEKLLYDYLEKSGWDEERAIAWQYLGDIYNRAKKNSEAVSCYLSSIKERHDFPWVYIRLASAYADLQDWDRVIHFTKIGINMPEPKTGMTLEPRNDRLFALMNLFEACIGKNKLKEAFAITNELLKIVPDSKIFKEKQKEIVDAIHKAELSRGVLELVKEAKELDEPGAAIAILNNLPSSIADNALVESLRHEMVPPITWPKDSIVYLTGRGAEPWDETSLAKGVGGSETAVIQLTRYWSQRGYKVTVYGDPVEGSHIDKHGVEWLPYWMFNPKDTFDIFIGWRSTLYFSQPIKARKTFVDFHDMVSSMNFDKEIVKNIDHFMFKSQFQLEYAKEQYVKDKAIIVPNGFDESTITQSERDSNKVIYASSYDRGLYELLKYGWPIVKKHCPDAVLHVYYGWNIFDTFFRDNSERMRWKEKMISLMEEHGVVEHGRISQKELMKEKAAASVHYYPTTFEEIDCISVRESAASGCIPVTSYYAALQGKPYVISADGNPYDKKTQEKIAMLVVEALQGKHEDKRDKFAKLAQKETWKYVADKWWEVFK